VLRNSAGRAMLAKGMESPLDAALANDSYSSKAPSLLVTAGPEDVLARALARLTSLHQSDAAVAELIACGPAAIAPAKQVLMRQERSGLFQIRCAAVDVLAGLRAFETLTEFLDCDHSFPDPIAQSGEDAVVNAAARRLGEAKYQPAFMTLCRLAKRLSLYGVIEALAAYERPDVIPILVAALDEDASRPSAERGLAHFGATASPQLVDAARRREPPAGPEGVTSRRRRIAALRVLSESALDPADWLRLRPVMFDRNAEAAFLACKCGLNTAPAEHGAIVRRLADLRAAADWALCAQIDQILNSVA
jgi:hypothetical protein